MVPTEDKTHVLTRLIGRYGHEHGHYLFGELCLLRALGLEAFQARHTEAQLQAIASALGPLGLWPEQGSFGPDQPDALALVATTLVGAPLVLKVGVDLFWGMAGWAGAGGEGPGDPAAWFTPVAAALTETLGFAPPPLTVALDADVPPLGYRLVVAGNVVEEGFAYPHQDLLIGPADAPPPASPYAWTPDPAGPGWIAWMPVGPESEPPADLPRVHWLTAVSRHLAARLPRYASRWLTTGRVQELLMQAEATGYDHEIERYISVPELRLAFRALLDQGVPLRPIGTIMEGLTRAVLADLSGRKLPMDEIERLQRQLPVFSTPRLVGFCRRALGLPESPPPAFTMGLPPGPRPAAVPAIEAEARSRWLALIAAEKTQRAAAQFWLAALQRAMAPIDRRTGRYVLPGLALPSSLEGVPEAAALRDSLGPVGLDEVHETLRRYRQVARPLARVQRFLEDPLTPLSGEALDMLESPRFASWHWTLEAPTRLAARYGLTEALAAFQQAERPFGGQTGYT